MSQIIVYPRQYTSRVAHADGVVVSEGDAALTTLYDFFTNRTVNTSSWTYRAKVLDCAMRLFGDWQQWLLDQTRNPYVVGYNEAFVEDCLRFADGQPRQLSVENWVELVAELAHTSSSVSRLQRTLSTPSHTRPQSTAELLQRWCSQPGGFEDLLGSLFVLFGRARIERS